MADNEELKPVQEAAQTAKSEKPAKKGSSKNPFRSKKFKHGTLSVVFTIIFITAIVLVNVIFNLVLARFDVAADLTSGSIFTLGEETENYIKNLGSRIEFYITADEDALTASGEPLYKQVAEFVEKMTKLNGNFSVKYVNLLTDPDFSSGFTETLQNYQIIVKSGDNGRYRILNISDCLKYKLSDGNTYGYQEAAMYVNYGMMTVADYFSTAEEELVSAVQSVSNDNPTVVAFASGFGESDSSALAAILEKNAYVTKTVDIDMLEAVPDDVDILVIHGPRSDYSLDAVTKLDRWLSNGGKYGKNMVYIASADAVKTPNLDEFLKEWGLEIGYSYVCQMDTNYAYSVQGYAYPLYQKVEVIGDTDYYSNMKINNSASFRANGLRPVKKLWEEEGNFYNKTLVQTYGEKCVLMPFDADENWDYNSDSAEWGQFAAVVEASKVHYEGTTPVYSKIIAAGSDQLFDQYYTTASNYNNGEFALTIFDTNSENKQEKIKIVEKSFTAETYQLDQSQQVGIGLVFAVIIPVIIVVAGIIVWAKRRRL